MSTMDIIECSLPSTDDGDRITTGSTQAITLALSTTGTVQSGQVPLPIGSVQVQSVELTSYSANLVTIKDSAGAKYVTAKVTAGVTIEFSKPDEKSDAGVTEVKVQSATKTGEPKINLITTDSSTPKTNITVQSVTPVVTVKKSDRTTDSVEISLAVEEIRVTQSSSPSTNITQLTVTIPVNITLTPAGEGGASTTSEHTINFVQLTLPVPTSATQNKLNIQSVNANDEESASGKTLEITVRTATAEEDGTEATAEFVQASGRGFCPIKGHHCIYSVRDSTGTGDKKDIWANIAGKCEYTACYYKNSGKTQALLILYFRSGGTPEKKYFGTQNAKDTNTHPWKTIPSEDEFIENLKTLATSSSPGFTLTTGQDTEQYDREYGKVLWNL